MLRLRVRLVLHQGDCVRRLHCILHLTFPEFKNHVRTLQNELATTVCRVISGLTHSRRCVPKPWRGCISIAIASSANAWPRLLIQLAKDSVGHHYAEPYQLQIKYLWRTLLCRANVLQRSSATSPPPPLAFHLTCSRVGRPPFFRTLPNHFISALSLFMSPKATFPSHIQRRTH
jgi:hypothetical protein